eukprot:1136927-Pelagomonas_calceolata.AAC.9
MVRYSGWQDGYSGLCLDTLYVCYARVRCWSPIEKVVGACLRVAKGTAMPPFSQYRVRRVCRGRPSTRGNLTQSA